MAAMRCTVRRTSRPGRALVGERAVKLIGRAWRIVVTPRSEWDAVRAQSEPWWSSLVGHVLPLAFLPAVSWAAGRSVGAPVDAAAILPRFAEMVVSTVALSLLCVALLAAAFYILAPMYDIQRNWARAVSVAAYGSTPVLLAGVLLVMPIMIMASMVAMLHCFLLYYVGLHRVIGCRQSSAAEYLAVSCLVAVTFSAAFGAVAGAVGIL